MAGKFPMKVEIFESEKPENFESTIKLEIVGKKMKMEVESEMVIKKMEVETKLVVNKPEKKLKQKKMKIILPKNMNKKPELVFFKKDFKKTTWRAQSKGFREWVQKHKMYLEAQMSPGKQWKTKSAAFRKFVADSKKKVGVKPKQFTKLTSWRKTSKGFREWVTQRKGYAAAHMDTR